MSMNDPLSDLLSRIRNAQMRNKSKVTSPNSRLRERVLEVLKTEGYIRGYATVAHSDGGGGAAAKATAPLAAPLLLNGLQGRR